jgi:hypothetical protein
MIIVLKQSIIDNMEFGHFDDNLLEDTEMAVVDMLIDADQEAEASLLGESAFFDTVDHILDI